MFNVNVSNINPYGLGVTVGFLSGGLLATYLYWSYDRMYTEGKKDGMELASDLYKADEKMLSAYRKELREKELREAYEQGRAEGIRIGGLRPAEDEDGGEQDE